MQFKLVNGTVFTGRPIAAKDATVQVAIDTGGYTNLYWAQLSQETLRELQESKVANVAPLASVFIDPAPTRRATARTKAVTMKEVPRLDRPTGGSLFASPVMIVLLLILYGMNVYAAYEIAVFRQQPPALVCVVAAILPLIGPAIFIAMPTRQPPEEHLPIEQPEHPHEPETIALPTEQPVEAAPAAAEQPAAPQAVTYSRGQFTFNRRFFETKFAGFLKLVPGEAERDKVIVIKSARGEHTGARFSKIEPNEVFFQVRKGNATEDVMIPFNEIYEVTIKPKDT
jgi:hypothetical protein